MFDWMREKKSKLWGLGVFSSGLPKIFLPKMERKLERGSS